MRIAIFDGILETHLASSLERALVARGHVVHNTGKVGHGFEFPTPGVDLSHLQQAISDVVAHRPDWIIVMRPASLPPHLLCQLKDTGAGLAVWLSDDPVLFHLSYAPVLEDYDLVLHCGTATVLQAYEDFFGRPTGVNFPFWTDHIAFPYVWGSEQPESTALFLGNVHDQVRRKRYFALGGMRTDVRIHGNVGTDYLGLWGGYLDNDAEVVNAGARAQVALNIPQFFRDHRGLPTWFPGLDELGFFEYPSRVVQYIAMGLPVITMIPGTPEFRSLPEMQVVEDVAAADALINELQQGDGMRELSIASERRFSRHFSAASRVLAFEALTTDDSWRGLDAVERNMWFTQFDGSDAVADDSTIPERVDLDRFRTGPEHERNVVVVGRETDRQTSRPAVTARALRRLGYQVRVFDFGQHPGKLPDLGGADGVVVCGANLAGLVSEAQPGTWRVLVDDTSHTAWEVSQYLVDFDAVGVRSPRLADQLAAAGHTRLQFCPPAVDDEYLQILDGLKDVATLVHTHASPETDNRFAEALKTDVIGPDHTVQRYDQLWGTDLETLARSSRCRIGLVGFIGDRSNPVVDEITPFAAAAADVLVIPRITPEQLVAPYTRFGIQVRERGELAVKLRRLADSRSLRAVVGQPLPDVLRAEVVLAELIESARGASLAEESGRFARGLVRNGMLTVPKEVDKTKPVETQRTLDVFVEARVPFDLLEVLVLEDGEVIHHAPARRQSRFVLRAGSGRSLGPLAVQLRYLGPNTLAPAEDLATVSTGGEVWAESLAAMGTARGTKVWRAP